MLLYILRSTLHWNKMCQLMKGLHLYSNLLVVLKAFHNISNWPVQSNTNGVGGAIQVEGASLPYGTTSGSVLWPKTFWHVEGTGPPALWLVELMSPEGDRLIWNNELFYSWGIYFQISCTSVISVHTVCSHHHYLLLVRYLGLCDNTIRKWS